VDTRFAKIEPDEGTGPGFAWGPGSHAAAHGSAFGVNANANGTDSFAAGENAFAAGQGDLAVGFNSHVGADNSTAVGTNTSIAASSPNSTAIGAGATVGANAANSTALGFGATINANASNSVALGANSVASAPNTVSVGAAGSERRITNVAAGVGATDAVNVGQLTALANSAQAGILNLDHRVNRAYSGVAMGMAMSAAPLALSQGEQGISGGVGTFGGRTAFGFHYQGQPTGKLNIGVAIGVGVDGTVGASAGLGVKF
jgi:autotransporter adhesin